jgi:hypothetical protein
MKGVGSLLGVRPWLKWFYNGTGRRSWTGLYGAVGVMAGTIFWVACTLGGGVVGRHLGWTVVGGIGGGLAGRSGAR